MQEQQCCQYKPAANHAGSAAALPTRTAAWRYTAVAPSRIAVTTGTSASSIAESIVCRTSRTLPGEGGEGGEGKFSICVLRGGVVSSLAAATAPLPLLLL